MHETVTIPARFVGPPDSGHGGYTCGIVATALSDGPVEVTLRRPPPVERPLVLAKGANRVELRDGDLLVAEAAEADPAIEVPDVISFAAAQHAAAAFDEEGYAKDHPFPTCFACGPGREPGDGLRLFPALAGPHLVVWPWVPDESLAEEDGRVAPVFLWAALDCPSGLAWNHDVPHPPPHVLGRLTAAVHQCPRPGDELVVAGWQIAVEGRKRQCGSVVWNDRGEVLAAGQAVWIALDESQHSQFRPARK